MKIVIATFNEGKFKEFKDLFSESSFEILSLNDFSTKDIDETGGSYEENAMLKAMQNAMQNAMKSGNKLKKWPGSKKTPSVMFHTVAS